MKTLAKVAYTTLFFCVVLTVIVVVVVADSAAVNFFLDKGFAPVTIASFIALAFVYSVCWHMVEVERKYKTKVTVQRQEDDGSEYILSEEEQKWFKEVFPYGIPFDITEREWDMIRDMIKKRREGASENKNPTE